MVWVNKQVQAVQRDRAEQSRAGERSREEQREERGGALSISPHNMAASAQSRANTKSKTFPFPPQKHQHIYMYIYIYIYKNGGLFFSFFLSKEQ